MQRDALLAFKRVSTLAVGARRCGCVGKVVARLRLLVRERKGQLALNDRGYQLAQERTVAGMAKRTAAENDGREVGLDRQRASERLGKQHGFRQPLSQPAMLLGKWNAEQTQLSILAPQGCAVAVWLLHVALALGQLAIGARKQPIDAVLQLALLVAEIEIHVFTFPYTCRLILIVAMPDRPGIAIRLESTQKPSTALARMLRWISLEPP